jgi:tetratricopeptide (TPR) repeat protein
VWSGLPDDTRNGVFNSLQAHFDSAPKISDWQQVDGLEDLTPAIELYNTLIGLKRYEEAWHIFRFHIDLATDNRLSASDERIRLLEMLFEGSQKETLLLNKGRDRTWAFGALAETYLNGGQPTLAAQLCVKQLDAIEYNKDRRSHNSAYNDLSGSLRVLGKLLEAESAASRALIVGFDMGDLFRQAISYSYLGRVLTSRNARLARNVLQRSLKIFVHLKRTRSEGVSNALIAELDLKLGNLGAALDLANRAWNLSFDMRQERDFIRSARLQGVVAMYANALDVAEERLNHAFGRSRVISFFEEMLQIEVALAELRRRQKDLKAARELLDDVWEYAERGPYPLFHADAFNVLAQIERDAGNNAAAVEAATKAYRLAWCDGEPYAYHWGLVAARKHLRELGAPEPKMPPFDASKHEPMPEVEINPHDEFYVEPTKDE